MAINVNGFLTFYAMLKIHGLHFGSSHDDLDKDSMVKCYWICSFIA